MHYMSFYARFRDIRIHYIYKNDATMINMYNVVSYSDYLNCIFQLSVPVEQINENTNYNNSDFYW